MLSIIIIIISLILDGILSNFLPYMVNDLSLFTPLLTIVSFIIIYPFYRKKRKQYFLMTFFVGIIYDLLYTNLLFFNALLFLAVSLFIHLIYKNLEVNYFNIIIYIVLIIIVYESIQYLIFIIFNLIPVDISKLIYKISHSLLLNIIYTELLFIIVNLLPKKFKKININ